MLRRRLSDWYWACERFDLWHRALIHFYEWRVETFPWYYDHKAFKLHQKNMMEKFGRIPQKGDLVEDCRGQVRPIYSVDPKDPDTVTFKDGFTCSLWHCCDLPPDA